MAVREAKACGLRRQDSALAAPSVDAARLASLTVQPKRKLVSAVHTFIDVARHFQSHQLKRENNRPRLHILPTELIWQSELNGLYRTRVVYFLSAFTAAFVDLVPPPFFPVSAVMTVPVSTPTAKKAKYINAAGCFTTC